MRKVIWISWLGHRRSTEICDFLEIPFFVIIKNNKSVLEYFRVVVKTLKLIACNKPRLLIIQNPSLILNVIAVMIRPFFRYKLVVDAHNEAVEPYVNQNIIIENVSTKLISFADITIVTNRFLSKTVERNNGRPFILPDRIPTISNVRKQNLTEKFSMVLVSTYEKDEPYNNVFKAVSGFENILDLYVTGNYKKLKPDYITSVPGNVHLTGYLSDSDYFALMNSVDVIIDLTCMDNCLVCGAYESVALKTPLILSGNQATKEYFYKGVIYTDNSISDLKRAIKSSMEKIDVLKQQISELHTELQTSWLEKADIFRKQLEML